jgi:hypothetical protein
MSLRAVVVTKLRRPRFKAARRSDAPRWRVKPQRTLRTRKPIAYDDTKIRNVCVMSLRAVVVTKSTPACRTHPGVRVKQLSAVIHPVGNHEEH